MLFEQREKLKRKKSKVGFKRVFSPYWCFTMTFSYTHGLCDGCSFPPEKSSWINCMSINWPEIIPQWSRALSQSEEHIKLWVWRGMNFSWCFGSQELVLLAVPNPALVWVGSLEWSQDDKTIAHHTVNLLTSTIKIDAEQSDLRFCFRIISPSKNYTLQVLILVVYMDIC
jgi:hypothetical protein